MIKSQLQLLKHLMRIVNLRVWIRIILLVIIFNKEFKKLHQKILQISNHYNYHQFKCELRVGVKKNKMEKRHKKALVLFIIIILLIGVEITIEVCCKIYNKK